MAGPLTGRGTNVVDQMLSSTHDASATMHDINTSSPVPLFQKAVIVEIFLDPSSLTNEQIGEIDSSVGNPDVLRNMPRNSILARIVTGGRDKQGASPLIFYPFFPAHLSFPAKPGEQVWVVFESPEKTSIGYWICRVPEREDVDDVNYTHADRKFNPGQELSLSERAGAQVENDTKPNFLNGSGVKETLSLQNIDDYEKIVSGSFAYKSFTPEPVPRFRKRAGDWVAQGSNNTLIVLGEDRVAKNEKSEDEKKTTAGSIDIVAGRSTRNFPIDENGTPNKNAPHIALNTRGNFEVDKNPQVRGKTVVTTEGDPDFESDLSRIYVSMRTDGDKNLNLVFPNINGNEVVSQVDDKPFVILKSDEIRIVARNDSQKSINGSIKIVKEGSEDQAIIMMQPDGTVYVDGTRLIFGIGSPNQIFIGRDASEAAVLGNTLVSLLTLFLDDLETYAEAVSTSVGNLGAPIPQLISAHVTLVPRLEEFKQKLETALSVVCKVK